MLSGLLNRVRISAAVQPNAVPADPSKALALLEYASQTPKVEYAVSLILQATQCDPDNPKIVDLLLQKGGLLPEGNLSQSILAAIKDSARPVFFGAVIESARFPAVALNAVNAAEKAEQFSSVQNALRLADRAVEILSISKPPRQDIYVRLTDVFEKLGAKGKAASMLRIALELDSTKHELKRRLQDLSTENHIDVSGVGNSGPGAFKGSLAGGDVQIRNQAAKPLDQAAESEFSLALERYKADPQNAAAIETLSRFLVRFGSKERLEQALDILKPAFQATSNPSFRRRIADIEIRLMENRLHDLRNNSGENSSMAAAAAGGLEEEIIKKKITEFEFRTREEPKDIELKLKLARLYNQDNRHQDAILLCQQNLKEESNAEQWAAILMDSMLSCGKLNEAGAFIRYLAPHEYSAEFVCRFGLRTASAMLEKASGDGGLSIMAGQAYEILGVVGAINADDPELAGAVTTCEAFLKNRDRS